MGMTSRFPALHPISVASVQSLRFPQKLLTPQSKFKGTKIHKKSICKLGWKMENDWI